MTEQRKNKFGFDPVEAPVRPKRERAPGPMGAAVREAAADLQSSTDAKIEQRKQNSEDAKAYRAAQGEGRLIERVALGTIHTDALPRDRLDLDDVAISEAMDELKASILARGQKEPIEVWRDADGRLQLKKGWRRLTALRQLYEETGDEAFSEVLARVEKGQGGRLDRYVDMVEENVVREDLTFAEMAAVVLEAANDPDIEEDDPAALVARLYGALHKTKRSYIRSFVYLLSELGDDLRFPKAVPRNLGVDVARRLQNEGMDEDSRKMLSLAPSEETQRIALETFVAGPFSPMAKKRVAKVLRDSKVTVRVGDAKVVAKDGECRIVMEADFASVPQDRLEEALRRFSEVILEG